MHDLTDLLRPETVLIDVGASAKKPLLTAAATALAPIVGVSARAIGDALAARERIGSTGFGGGVAIPHARLDGILQIAGVFMRLAQPVEFGSVDALPVDLAFVLLSPTDAGAAYLKALARVSRRLRDRSFVAKLRGAGSRDALYALFAADDARDAA